MATYFAYNVPAAEVATTATPGATTSTAEIVLGNNALFAVTCDGASNIKFGNAGMAAAAATDFALPANSITYWEIGVAFDRIRIFTVAATRVSVQKLSRS